MGMGRGQLSRLLGATSKGLSYAFARTSEDTKDSNDPLVGRRMAKQWEGFLPGSKKPARGDSRRSGANQLGLRHPHSLELTRHFHSAGTTPRRESALLSLQNCRNITWRLLTWLADDALIALEECPGAPSACAYLEQ
jgi:hypothetical protein